MQVCDQCDGEGCFVKGQGKKASAELKEKVKQVEAFYIDRFEYPNRLKDADGQDQLPVAKANWQSASAACSEQHTHTARVHGFELC